MTFKKVSVLFEEKVVSVGGPSSGGGSGSSSKCTCAGSCTVYAQEFNENDI